MCKIFTDKGEKNSYSMVCPPVREIIHELKLKLVSTYRRTNHGITITERPACFMISVKFGPRFCWTTILIKPTISFLTWFYFWYHCCSCQASMELWRKNFGLISDKPMVSSAKSIDQRIVNHCLKNITCRSLKSITPYKQCVLFWYTGKYRLLTMPWVGLQSVIVAFPGYTHLLSDQTLQKAASYRICAVPCQKLDL